MRLAAPLMAKELGQPIVVSRTDAPFKTLAQRIAYAHVNLGKLTVGSSCVGTTTQMIGEFFKIPAGGLRLFTRAAAAADRCTQGCRQQCKIHREDARQFRERHHVTPDQFAQALHKVAKYWGALLERPEVRSLKEK
jgi:hypothetical protein